MQYKKVTENKKRLDRVKVGILPYLTSHDGHGIKKSVFKAVKSGVFKDQVKEGERQTIG